MRDSRQRHAPASLRIASDCSWPGRPRLEIAINTRENFTVLGDTRHPFPDDSRWYSGDADIAAFELDRLPATKMRARYERRTGRDLFNLAMELARRRSNARRIDDVFEKYMDRDSGLVTRAMFERNLVGKILDTQFHADMSAPAQARVRVTAAGSDPDGLRPADLDSFRQAVEGGTET